jgi:hypothetical protein
VKCRDAETTLHGAAAAITHRGLMVLCACVDQMEKEGDLALVSTRETQGDGR